MGAQVSTWNLISHLTDRVDINYMGIACFFTSITYFQPMHIQYGQENMPATVNDRNSSTSWEIRIFTFLVGVTEKSNMKQL